MESAPAKKKPVMLMLAAHEPFDDPRVDWAARTCAQFYDTRVFGLGRKGGSRLQHEDVGPYRIWRFSRPQSIQLDFILLLLRGAAEHAGKRLGMRAPNPLILLVTLFLAPLEIFLRFIADVVGVVWRWRPVVVGRMAAQMRGAPEFSTRALPSRRGIWPRLRMFVDILRHVLSTAQLFRLGAADLPGIDVVYCNDLDTLLPGVLIAMSQQGIKLIYDSHEYWPYSNVEALGIHVWFFRAFERVLSRRADSVLTVSGPLADELKRAYRLAEVKVLPNAEPWVERPPAPARTGTQLASLAAGRVSFLFQGNFAPQRGLEELVDAWAGVDSGKAVLFLRGPDNPWRRDIAERAGRLGLLDRTVFVLPPVTVDELVAAAREVDVGIIPYKPDHPAYRFACPNKLSQYMHAGLAILSNNIGYVAEQIAAAKCGAVYESSDRASIIAAVMKLAEDREALESFRRNALAYGRDTFNWQVQSRPLVTLLRTWASEISPPSAFGEAAD